LPAGFVDALDTVEAEQDLPDVNAEVMYAEREECEGASAAIYQNIPCTDACGENFQRPAL